MADTGVFQQLRSLWSGLSASRRMLLVGAGVGTLLLIGYASMSGSKPDYAMAYSGLSPEDAGALAQRLEESGTPYELAAGGTTILVPKDKVYSVRIGMASVGLPRGAGVGFEIFDKQSIGTTSFGEQMQYKRAMQGELARTIAALQPVAAVRVHLSMGKRSIFKESEQAPTASVALRLHGTTKLSSEQVRGIVHLVSSSVSGMTVDAVKVIDGEGNVLSVDAKHERRSQHSKLEASFSSRLRNMLERITGVGRVAVSVTIEMDNRTVETTEEKYDPESTAVRSETRDRQGPGALDEIGGVAGARGNLAGAPAATTKTANGASGVLKETRNFEVSRVVTHTVGMSSPVRRLHVAVLLDNKIVPDPDSEEEGATKSIPHTAEEIEYIVAIAREAVGLDESRGDRLEVRNVPFVKVETPEIEDMSESGAAAWPLPVSQSMLGAIVAGIFALLIFIVVLRGSKRTKLIHPDVLTLPAAVHEFEKALAHSQLGDGQAVTHELGAGNAHSRVLAAVGGNTERASRVISALLAGDVREQ